MELTEFLLARIDEDEEAASAAGSASWVQPDPVREHGRVESGAGDVVVHDEGSPSAEEAQHIVRHDPARVLAECQAKRRVVALARVMESMESTIECEYGSLVQPSAGVEFDEPVTAGDGDTYPSARLLQHLAVAYADHPDYDEAWRP